MKTVIKLPEWDATIAGLAILILAASIFNIYLILYCDANDDIDRAYERLHDASYLAYDETSDPVFSKAFYELEEQIEKHPYVFEERCNTELLADILRASDIIKHTHYLDDFRSVYSMEYIKAYLDYYEDEYAKIKEAYKKGDGTFHPAYIKN